MKTSQGLSGGLFVKGGGRKGLLVGLKNNLFRRSHWTTILRDGFESKNQIPDKNGVIFFTTISMFGVVQRLEELQKNHHFANKQELQ